MHYTTYWSILDSPGQTIQSNIICLYVALGSGLLWFLIKRFKKDEAAGDKALLVWGTGIFAILGFVGFISFTFLNMDHSNELAKKILNDSNTPRVEGVVSDFEQTIRRSNSGGERIEKFTVDSVQFAYGDAALGQFSSFSETNNKIIFNGQKVRITYKEGSPYCDDCNSILKIEVAK